MYESIKQILKTANYIITKEVSHLNGIRLYLASKQIINIWNNGNFSVQGKNPGIIEELLNTYLNITQNSSSSTETEQYVTKKEFEEWKQEFRKQVLESFIKINRKIKELQNPDVEYINSNEKET
jgi:hypothetical protein